MKALEINPLEEPERFRAEMEREMQEAKEAGNKGLHECLLLLIDIYPLLLQWGIRSSKAHDDPELTLQAFTSAMANMICTIGFVAGSSSPGQHALQMAVEVLEKVSTSAWEMIAAEGKQS